MTENLKCSKKIKKGDKVVAIAGNYRGMSGTVLSCKGEKVIVQGLNVRKRHMKGSRDKKGEIVQIERPIHISNLKPCTGDGKPLKLFVRKDAQGERKFYYLDGEKQVEYRSLKKSK